MSRGRCAVVLCALLTVLTGCRSTPDLTTPEAHVRTTLGGKPALLLEPSPRPRAVVLVVGPDGDGPEAIDREPQLFAIVSQMLVRGQSVAAAGDPVALSGWLARRGYQSIELLTLGSGAPRSMRLFDQIRPASWVGIRPKCETSSLARKVFKAPMTFFGDDLGRCPSILRRRDALVSVLPSKAGLKAEEAALAAPKALPAQ